MSKNPSIPEISAADKTAFIEQYKLYVEMLEGSNKRRMDTNALFISINAFMVTFHSLFNKGNALSTLLVCAAGIAFSVVWFALLKNYNVINGAKWDVLYDMEQSMPYKPFYSEWYEKLGYPDDKPWRKGNNLPSTQSSPKRYSSISILESNLPWGFVALYVVMGLYYLMNGSEAVGLIPAIAEVNDSIASLNNTLAEMIRAGIGG